MCRRTTGQAARAIPVWMERTAAIAAGPKEVRATAAVPLDWAAAMVVDPLLWMTTNLRDRASAGPMETVMATVAVSMSATASAAKEQLVLMELVMDRPSLVNAEFIGQEARVGMLPMEQVVTSAVSTEPTEREELASTVPW